MGFQTIEHTADLCVVGGGMAGMCAAISAARHGAKVVLMHERPMLGGNASSEIRMWVCGADGKNNRETGILEEIRLENYHRNQHKNYAVWDTILYEKVISEPNITLLLNCSCCDAKMDGNRLVSVTGWQMTTQTWHTVTAQLFSDCSGDSVLQPLTGAEYRMGREAASEFNEKVSVLVADCKTMGMSCLIQAREYDRPSTFIAPPWAKKLDAEILKYRRPNIHRSGENFWYLELGGDKDSIRDTETVRDELLALAMGMWDYVKNSGEFDADNWQLDFLGFLPGKRESRRMMGDYIMTQNDVLSGGIFDDTVAFGGWPLDDHDPAGFYHVGHPNQSYNTPSPYGIPYRCLYSVNIANLFFAGRNISMTHAAMSSSRVMATCCLLGQAVGTAAAIGAREKLDPREIGKQYMDELQQTLMDDDCFLPGRFRPIPALTKTAALTADRDAEQLENLRNGADRENRTYPEGEKGVRFPAGTAVTYTFADRSPVESLRLVFDSDLNRATIPAEGVEQIHNTRATVPLNYPIVCMPKTLIRDFTVELLDGADVVDVLDYTDNVKRLVQIPIGRTLTGVRCIYRRDWGDNEILHTYSEDCR